MTIMGLPSKNNHKTPQDTRTDCRSDNTGRVADHGMHQEKIFRIFGPTYQIFKKFQTTVDTLLPA